ncbi:probable G-protein coupled receptor 139 [Stegostoma tigrinum]|uniref:probable G-protein coupled receptor 139 n=1 Tax=Stegostoma tigrinum TaxID=3053191 RepID=UPI00286FFCC0|nr:probable G-protein coupled receptor 139 [Stegostoma tigrinum]
MNRTFDRIMKVYYAVLAAIGVPVNLAAIVILSRGNCGLSTCTTYYLVSMSAADLMVVITEVILIQFQYFYYPLCFLNITPMCSIIDVLARVAADCSVWFTVTFTIDRFMAICCQKLKTKYCTKTTAVVVCSTTCSLLFLKNIPFYFVYEPGKIVDNVPWFCVIKPSIYIDPGWLAFDWLDTILTPILPFVLILFLNALTVRHILLASRVRKELKGQSKSGCLRDSELESRRRSVLLLFTISGSFILLWLAYVIFFIYYIFTGIEHSNYVLFWYIFGKVCWMLRTLNCCTNTFIYGVTQSQFRKQVKSAVKYPLTAIIRLINKDIILFLDSQMSICIRQLLHTTLD